MNVFGPHELAALGFKSVGRDVCLSRKASIYGAERIAIGDNVRIDDFCILSAGAGGISIGSNIHIAAYTSLIGAGAIALEDFCNLSSRVSIYSSSDDYSGRTLTNPTIEDDYKAVDSRPVTIGRHVIVGCGSVVLPGVTFGEGSAVGALSLVNKDCDPFTIYAGQPCRAVKVRERSLLTMEHRWRDRRRGLARR